MQWSPGQFRAAYHFNRFTAGWRQLLVFYMAMTLAGYAMVIHGFIFYGAWGALVLMYWEPYLSPPFPWTSDAPLKDSFGVLLQMGFKSQPTDAEAAHELEGIQQWVLAIQRGLNETQLRVYKVLYGAIVIPFACLVVGMVQQATIPHYSRETQAVYAAALLLALLTVYTASVYTCLWIFHCVQAQESDESRANEVDWQPHDMMFFMCKILGETLNTVVQTLVAGSFTAYMPWPIFWLCILITSLSYTATNLLYDFDSDAPVSDEPVTARGCTMFRNTKTSSKQQEQQQQQQQQDAECSLVGEPCGNGGPTGDVSVEKAARDDSTFERDTSYAVCDHSAAEAGQYQPAEAADTAGAGAGAAAPQVCRKHRLRLGQSNKPKRPPLPPFLKYKWPKGLRGKAIVWLLLSVCVPSVLLLLLIAKGFGENGHAELFLSDPDGECADQGDSCLGRYQQLLVILGCLGCLISYYAFTIGFLGAGPVTWLYQMAKKAKR